VGRDAQTAARPNGGHAIHLIPQQNPMWTLEEFAEMRGHSRGAANRRIRRAIFSSQPRGPERPFQRKSRFRVVEVQLLRFAATPHAAALLQHIEEFR
jgi:hypothetical protein